ncbi:MAG: hypothetical protein GX442_10505 [Candidatus Riflebacteria bacterium]|nr:hypothetical protein [Candidatus Riflebacteria bacterium]
MIHRNHLSAAPTVAIFILALSACLAGVPRAAAAGDRPDRAGPDFAAVRRGLADGSFVPIAFQHPNSVVGHQDGRWEVSHLRWEVTPVKGLSWYAVPHRFATARIDPAKARQVIVGRHTISPLLLHAFLIVTFDEGGLTVDGQSSQGLVLSVEPLLRRDQHSWKVPIEMGRGRFPKLYQLGTWEDHAVFSGGIMKQMAWLRPLRSADAETPCRLVEALIRFATAAPATQPFDYKVNNCAASLLPILAAALPPAEADRLRAVLAASEKPHEARWFPKHLEKAGLLDGTKPVRLYRDNFFVPLARLCRDFFPARQR